MKIIHLSDMHFGTEISGLAEKLVQRINDATADMVIISGDFTQTATLAEFATAKEFLKIFKIPVFCVPGNHDVPRYDIIERFCKPFDRYKAYISEDLSPVYQQGDICIAGINTARSILPHWNWAHGAVSGAQIRHIQKVFAYLPDAFKICVMHHPVHVAQDNPINTTVFGGARALKALRALKVDLVLTGHVHHPSIITLGDENHKTVFLSASTALSRRVRSSGNGFNVIHIEEDKFQIEILTYNAKKEFERLEIFEHNFRR